MLVFWSFVLEASLKMAPGWWWKKQVVSIEILNVLWWSLCLNQVWLDQRNLFPCLWLNASIVWTRLKDLSAERPWRISILNIFKIYVMCGSLRRFGICVSRMAIKAWRERREISSTHWEMWNRGTFNMKLIELGLISFSGNTKQFYVTWIPASFSFSFSFSLSRSQLNLKVFVAFKCKLMRDF